jgi:hypothetical protein
MLGRRGSRSGFSSFFVAVKTILIREGASSDNYPPVNTETECHKKLLKG